MVRGRAWRSGTIGAPERCRGGTACLGLRWATTGPLLGDSGWLCISSYPVCEAGDVVPAANPFEKTTILHRSALSAQLGEETVLLTWHPRHDLPEQQALYLLLQLVRDDPTLQARVEQPVEEMAWTRSVT